MTCGKGGLHCPCGIPASDERVSRDVETHAVEAFDEYMFSIEVSKFHCVECGYTSVTASVENPYVPVKIPGEGTKEEKQDLAKPLRDRRQKRKSITKRRISNIIKRMLDRVEFYTNETPRISRKEIEAMAEEGFNLQVEHTHGAMPGPIAVYPLHFEQFKKRAQKWLRKNEK